MITNILQIECSIAKANIIYNKLDISSQKYFYEVLADPLDPYAFQRLKDYCWLLKERKAMMAPPPENVDEEQIDWEVKPDQFIRGNKIFFRSKFQPRLTGEFEDFESDDQFYRRRAIIGASFQFIEPDLTAYLAPEFIDPVWVDDDEYADSSEIDDTF